MIKYIVYLFLFFFLKSFSQIEVIGSTDFGRIVDITYDPIRENTLYAATLGNHLVKSTDNGATWHLFYSHPDREVFIQNLKIFGNDKISFTVDTGYGNWNKIFVLEISSAEIFTEYNIPIPIGADESEITSYDFYTNDPQFIVVQQIYGIGGARFAKVYYTNNGGNEWQEVYYNGNFGSIFPNGVAISPGNPNKLFIARQGGLDPFDYGGLFISENGGVSWVEKLSGVDFNQIVFRPDNPNEILLGSFYGSQIQNLYRSIDNGNNWTEIDSDWSSEIPNGILKIQYDPTNFDSILVLGVNEIVRSFTNFQDYEVFHFQNEIENFDNYYFGSNVSFNPFNSSELFITNNDYPLFTSDGGETVNQVKNPFFFAIGNVNSFKSQSEENLYYKVQNGYLYKDLNTKIDTPYFIVPLQFFPNFTSSYYSDKNVSGRVYAFSSSFNGSGMGIMENHGNVMTSFPLSFQYIHDIKSKPDNNSMILASFSNDFATSALVRIDITDPNSVTQEFVNLPKEGLLSNILINSSSTNEISIALEGRIYRTVDNGVNWQLRSQGLESLVEGQDMIYEIKQNPLNSDQLTIATSKGVFTSLDDANNWIPLSNFHAQKVWSSSMNSNHIVAMDLDNNSDLAINYSSNGGQSWSEVPYENLKYITSIGAEVIFTENQAEIYLGTYDMGLVKYKVDLETLSIPEIGGLQEEVIVFPNPTPDVIHILSKNVQVQVVTLYSMDGKKIMDNNGGYGFDLNLSNLESGIYTLKIVFKSGNIINRKIIKK